LYDQHSSYDPYSALILLFFSLFELTAMQRRTTSTRTATSMPSATQPRQSPLTPRGQDTPRHPLS
jgi:hypothetical protein